MSFRDVGSAGANSTIVAKTRKAADDDAPGMVDPEIASYTRFAGQLDAGYNLHELEQDVIDH